MRFTSIEYWSFLLLVLVINYALKFRSRWLFLLTSSYFFYIYWEPIYGIVLLFSTVLDYLLAIKIHESETRFKRKMFLTFSVVANVSLLTFFKLSEYLSAFIPFKDQLFINQSESTSLNLLIPIGISFYTFQTLSYTIDIYRKRRGPEYHFGYFALYVSYFPQLITGPIERSTTLLPQLRKEISFKLKNITAGSKLIVWGLFKKLLIADILSYYANSLYNNVGDSDGLATLIGVFAYAFQLYLDFSAYTDIALGSAMLFGINLMANFDRPFRSKSISEFWNKWHISLTTWIFDYLYRPLSRKYRFDWRLNILICFIIIGVWHGITIGFLMFGLLNGLLYILSYYTLENERIMSKLVFVKWMKGPVSLLKSIIVVLSLSLTTIVFRANSIGDTLMVVKNLFVGEYNDSSQYFDRLQDFFILAITLTIFFVVQNTKGFQPKNPFAGFKNPGIRYGLYYTILFMLIIFGQRQEVEFIYFQF